MTPPAPTPLAPPAERVQPIGWLARLKLTEPVRMYAYVLCLVVITGLQLAGWLTGEWVQFSITDAAVVLGVAGTAEAARASVYSPRSTLQALRRATDR